MYLTKWVAARPASLSWIVNFRSVVTIIIHRYLVLFDALNYTDKRVQSRTAWAVRRPCGIRNCLHLRLYPGCFYKILPRKTRRATCDPTLSVETRYTPIKSKNMPKNTHFITIKRCVNALYFHAKSNMGFFFRKLVIV